MRTLRIVGLLILPYFSPHPPLAWASEPKLVDYSESATQTTNLEL